MYGGMGGTFYLSFFHLPLPSLALVLDRDHELVGLVDQVGSRGEHRVWPETDGNFVSERAN